MAVADPIERAERVNATFRLEVNTRRRIDLIAAALGIDKSEVVDRGIELMAEKLRTRMQTYLDEARRSFEGRDEQKPGELYTGRTRIQRAGGPVARSGKAK